MFEIIWNEEVRNLSDLIPCPYNPRTITKKAFLELKNKIKRLGYHTRIKINRDNMMSDGHQKHEALKRLGLTWVHVLVPSRMLTEAEFQEVVIESNMHSGEWDYNLLANNFAEDLLDKAGLKVPSLDDVDCDITESIVAEPDVTKQAITKLGDIWILGNHRLMCGDSTTPADINKLVGKLDPEFIYTDPPYGINVNTTCKDTKNANAKRGQYEDVLNDHDTVVAKKAFNLLTGAYSCPIVYWGANYFSDFLPPSKCWLAWYKREDLPSDSFCDTELAYTNCNKHSKTFPVQWKGMIKENEMSQKRVHPTQKPIKLAIDIFKYLKAGQSVCDPFGGSGTTLIACEKSNRNCYMMELSPHYCDVIIGRWEKLTGQKAMQEVSV